MILYFWQGSSNPRIALNGRILLRKPRLYQSCSAEEERLLAGLVFSESMVVTCGHIRTLY